MNKAMHEFPPMPPHEGDSSEEMLSENSGGPYFVLETGIEPDMDRILKVAKESTPVNIVHTILQEVGLAPNPVMVETIRQEGQAIWQEYRGELPAEHLDLYDDTMKPVRLHDIIVELLSTCDKIQQSFWLNYDRRSGQRVEVVEKLFTDTEPYENSSMLKAFDSLYYRMPGDERIQDAERIARLLIRNEVVVV